MYAALGLAGEVGCFSLIVSVGALLVGLWLDQVLGTKKILVLACVVISVPINLLLTLRVAQMLVRRIMPPDKLPKTSETAKNKPAKPVSDDDDDQ